MFKNFFQLTPVKIDPKEAKMPNKLRNSAQKAVHEILKPNFFEKIPLQDVFNALKNIGIVPLQEDDTEWSGILLGNKECGDPAASNQRVKMRLAFKNEMSGNYVKSTTALIIMWCRMGSGKIEVTGYIS